jgi:hypothetical protein
MCAGLEGRKDNLKKIDDYERKVNEQKAVQRKKEEEANSALNKRDERERKEGAFTEMFERIDAYEMGGMRAVKETFLNKKRDAESPIDQSQVTGDADTKRLMNLHFDNIK